MDTLHTFAPNLDGPASMRAANCQPPRADEGDGNLVADNDAAPAAELGHSLDADAAAAEHGEPSNGSPVCDESGLPLDLPAEFLIGVQRISVGHLGRGYVAEQ